MAWSFILAFLGLPTTCALAACSKPPSATEPPSVASVTVVTTAAPLREPAPSVDDARPAERVPMSEVSASAEGGIRIVEVSAVKMRSSFDMDAARASTVPPTVSFRLDGPPVKTGQTVTLHGLLENSGTAPVVVTVFPAGGIGFFVQPATGSARPKPSPPGSPMPPPMVPPPPLLVELPARTAVRVTNAVLLDEYDWTPGAPREIEWSLLFWNEPKPRGTVKLP
jgi:hypothetical protein